MKGAWRTCTTCWQGLLSIGQLPSSLVGQVGDRCLAAAVEPCGHEIFLAVIDCEIGFGPNVNDVTPCDCPSKRQKRQVREGGKAKTEEYK